MDSAHDLHVILGTGPLGRAVAHTLQSTPYRVRMVNRSGRTGRPERADVEVLKADVSEPKQAAAACNGAAVVYHCLATAYTDWPDTLPLLMQGAIAGAEAASARLVYGDNLYAYGDVEGPLTRDLPHAATTRKGRIRAAVADTLMDAHDSGRIEATIGRASDFYGPGVTHSVVGEQVFGRIVDGKAARVLGDPDQPHTYTYIRDFGRALVTLATHDDAPGAIWHVPSAQTMTTREFVEMIFDEAEQPVRVSSPPSWMIRAMGWVSPMMREVAEMLYESEKPFVADHSHFADAFGSDPTPHRDAIRKTLAWYRERKRSAS